jgi:hypothetical protein
MLADGFWGFSCSAARWLAGAVTVNRSRVHRYARIANVGCCQNAFFRISELYSFLAKSLILPGLDEYFTCNRLLR